MIAQLKVVPMIQQTGNIVTQMIKQAQPERPSARERFEIEG